MPIPVEAFRLPPEGRGTLQQRIRQIIADGVMAGRFHPGEKLPSSRGLAAHLGISRITVTLAYGELVAGDYLTSRGRSGYFVSDTAPRPAEFPAQGGARRDTVDFAALTGGRFSALPRPVKPEDWRNHPWPFIYGQIDPALFDHQNWRQCAVRALGRRDFEALTSDLYDRDDPLLIEYIRRTILPRRGIEAGADEVLLTLGAQNALWLTAQVLLPAGRVAVMENPCYPGLRSILGQNRCAVVAVDVDEGGLPPDAIPPGASVVFVTPSHHCPTNATMPLDRRIALLARAAAEDFVVVEDDYEFEMSFLAPVSPSLKSLDRDGRVIHVGSFSKSLFPGLRLGYIVGSAAFIAEARALRAVVLRHPPGHIQRTAAYFLSLGHHDSLINRLRATYRRRRQALDEAIAAEGLTVAGKGVFGGSSLWMRAPLGVDAGVLAGRLRAEGVLIEPGAVFFAPGAGQTGFYRIAYSSIPAGRIAEGVRRIAAAANRLAAEARVAPTGGFTPPDPRGIFENRRGQSGEA